MNIKFIQVSIEGFQSIGKEVIDLNNVGTILIKGKNKYEKYANSNGSGKSSIIESILYAIYGKTSSGVSNVKNKYYEKGCCVELHISIDNVLYKIIRCIDHKEFGTCVKLYKVDEDISGRNKTDTEKLIQEVIRINFDLLTSIIFLSQGFNSRFTLLGPSAKKDRIERLSNIEESIYELKSKISKLRDEYDSEWTKNDRNLYKLEGNKRTIESDCNNLESIIIKNESINSEEIPNINALNDKLSKLKDILSNLNVKSLEIMNSINNIKSKKNSLISNINSLKSENDNLLSKLIKLKEGVCYTCGHKIDEEFNKSEKERINNIVSDNNSKISELESQINNIEDISELQNNLNIINSKKSSINNSISEITNTINKYKDYKDVSTEKSMLVSKKAELVDIDKEISIYTDKTNELKDRITASDQCLSIITKQFRTYILKNVVNYLNNRLEFYSSKLYSNDSDIIKIDDKFNISLGDYDYYSLSGGEKRKVDIALIFAQRDLALDVSGLNSNLLILDEIYDNLDDKAISVVSEMILELSNSIDSIFIISHMNNVDIKYDSIMTVIKGEDRISSLRIGYSEE